MSLRDEMRAALEGLIEAEPETIAAPDGSALPALVTAPSLESEFLPGVEMQENAIRARLTTTVLPTLPDLQSLWGIRGKTYRLTKAEPHPSSILLTFEDENN